MMRLIPDLFKSNAREWGNYWSRLYQRVSVHKPQPYVESVYESLARLRYVLPSQRHQALLCDAEMRELDRESFTLAIARYMKEHPEVTDIPIRWLDFDSISKWLAMSTAELKGEALRRLEQLERWDKFAKANHPDVWETYRIRYINVWLNLQSANSGLFPSAMGNMAIFLDAVGASYDEIHLF